MVQATKMFENGGSGVLNCSSWRRREELRFAAGKVCSNFTAELVAVQFAPWTSPQVELPRWCSWYLPIAQSVCSTSTEVNCRSNLDNDLFNSICYFRDKSRKVSLAWYLVMSAYQRMNMADYLQNKLQSSFKQHLQLTKTWKAVSKNGVTCNLSWWREANGTLNLADPEEQRRLQNCQESNNLHSQDSVLVTCDTWDMWPI